MLSCSLFQGKQGKMPGQGRTFTGQQQDQTSLPFLTNEDNLIAQTNHQLHQHWSPLSITGTTWQLQEKSQSKGLKFTFQTSSSGPGSPPGPMLRSSGSCLTEAISKLPPPSPSTALRNHLTTYKCHLHTQSFNSLQDTTALYSRELG